MWTPTTDDDYARLKERVHRWKVEWPVGSGKYYIADDYPFDKEPDDTQQPVSVTITGNRFNVTRKER